MRSSRFIIGCIALAATCTARSPVVGAQDPVLKLLWQRSELVARVKVSKVAPLEMKRLGEYQWRITAEAKQVFKSQPEKNIPKTFEIVVTRVWRPGRSTFPKISIEKGREYLVFLKNGATIFGKYAVKNFGGVWALPYDTVLAAELEKLAKSDRKTAKRNADARRDDVAAAGRQFAARQVIRCSAFARVVSVKALPKLLPKGYRFRGYVVDAKPNWVLALDVEKHDRKIPMLPGIRRYYVADLKPVFQSADVSRIVGGRYRFSFTWHASSNTGTGPFQDFRAVRSSAALPEKEVEP